MRASMNGTVLDEYLLGIQTLGFAQLVDCSLQAQRIYQSRKKRTIYLLLNRTSLLTANTQISPENRQKSTSKMEGYVKRISSPPLQAR